MRFLTTLCSLVAAATPAWAVDWRPLPSSAQYQATVDLDSVIAQKGVIRFTVRRAYPSAQSHASGKEYLSTRLLYLADCNARTAALIVTQYYGHDRKLIQADVKPQVKSSELTAPGPGSDLAEALKLACVKLAETGGAAAPTAKPGESPPGAPAKPAPSRGSSGSGIVVNRSGSILTNEHVVRACDGYEVIDNDNRKLKATVLATDAKNDLALLATDEHFPTAAKLRKQSEPRLGESVTVVGYPLVGVLGDKPSVGFGNVTSTIGIRGNPAQMQISVPIQRGASGGPVLDQSANVIGVVVSKLDALKFAERGGDLPQNVNFAIRAGPLRAFLEANKVDVADSNDTATLSSTEIASRGATVTVRVRCLREGVPVAPATPPK
ncbi:MAG TPA: serine protease [Burkholderiales bacterium]|jgi:S1-C subfamily serine protease|nr:serine protease [Burkholderiales bacterium]